MASGKRGFILWGAAIAIIGTLISGFAVDGSQKSLNDAKQRQSALADASRASTASYVVASIAWFDAQLLDSHDKAGSKKQADSNFAKWAASDAGKAVNNLKASLNELKPSREQLANQALKACPTVSTVHTQTPQDVQQSAYLQCQARLSLALYDQAATVSSLDRQVEIWRSVGTGLQVLGILIALAKDLNE